MGRIVKLEPLAAEPAINLALDTLEKNKQAFVFVNTKRSAEKTAEDIARKSRFETEHTIELSEKILHVLPKPTQQCERLAKCVKKGIAFHHAGLHSRQKELVEEHFRSGTIKIICCTPTLAAGVDLPAFRAIIRDVKRFSGHGMTNIPVLEFHQMAGRAGRPSFDPYGEAIVVAGSDAEKEALFEQYVKGFPEEIYSKLAVEPVLRTYVLSLIAARFVQSKDQILEFFSRTFWAQQFKDLRKLLRIVEKMICLLEEWEFIQNMNDSYRATILGKRIAELYIDPFTAHQFVVGVDNASMIKTKPLSWLHLIGGTLEMRPHLKIRAKEYDEIQEQLALNSKHFLLPEPSMFEPEYEEWLHGFKTGLMLHDWIEEKDEEYLLEHYDIRPGETRVKLTTGDWLLYALGEVARIRQHMDLLKEIQKMRFRLKYGVKEELLPLLRLEGIGRVRARILFRAGIKDLGDVRKAEFGRLENILGKKIALSIKKQVGESVPEVEELPAPAPNNLAQWEKE
ncbi:MAG: helicase-related protein [Candidatus Woesearchaeota archaeon]